MHKRFHFLSRVPFLLGQDSTGIALMARPEHQNLIEQGSQLAVHQTHGLYGHIAAGPEAKQIQTSKSCRILVLLADGLFENIDFDMASLLCKLACGDALALVRMERVE